MRCSQRGHDRAAEGKEFSICTGLIEQRCSEDVVYRVTVMVVQNVCDGFVLGRYTMIPLLGSKLHSVFCTVLLQCTALRYRFSSVYCTVVFLYCTASACDVCVATLN
jgi:hypothetical protein